MLNSFQRGRLEEDRAFNYLKRQGLKPLTRNYKTPVGEIDIIMMDREVTVFIEVRARSKNTRMDSIETINQKKCKRIIQASNHYLQKTKRLDKDICRFDLILICGPLESAEIQWIKNAFNA